MHRDRLQEALELAAVPILEGMFEDCQRLPEPLSRLVAYIRDHLFDLGLTAAKAIEATGIRSHAIAAKFRAHLDTSIHGYIEVGRLVTGDRLLRLNEFGAGEISLALGYKNHETFLRAFKAWAGEVPSEVGAKANVPEIDYQTWRRFHRRELEPEAAKGVIQRFAELYPEETAEVVPSVDKELDAEPWIIVDSDDYLRGRAEEIWQMIRGLTPEEQRRRMCGCEFRSDALFNLLRQKSLEAGRRDRRQGIHLAEMALVSLERAAAHFGDRIHDLRALGHACVGNAYRLARDFPAADAAFERAEAEWRVPRRDRDHGIRAKIHDREVALRIFQRNYTEAMRLIDRARDLYRLVGDLRGEARLLLQLGAIHSYSGKLEKSIVVLGIARDLLGPQAEPDLSYVVYCNLAHDQAKNGELSLAVENLARARTFNRQLDRPLGTLRILWIDAMIQYLSGDLARAEQFFVAARGGYEEYGEHSSFGIISLDLAILYAEQDRWERVPEVAGRAVSILGSAGLHEETLASVRLLAEAIDAGEVSELLIRQVRDALLQDPLCDFCT